MLAAPETTTIPELLRGRGQVPLRWAVRIGLGRNLAANDSIYHALLWGVGTGVFNGIMAPPFLRPSIFLGCMLIAFGISYFSTIPWRWRLVPARSPVAMRLAANAAMALAMGYLVFFASLMGSTALMLGPASLSAGTLRAFAMVSVGGFIFAIIGFYIATAEDMVKREARLRRESRRHEEHARVARLAALRSQINPHFFFNALNTIAALIPSRPADAERAVELMATALRPVLTREQGMMATLEQELAVARAYGEIEQLRFGARVAVEYDIAPGALLHPLPSLTLQPLLENAFSHGAARTPEHFRVRINARLDGDLLDLELLSAPAERFDRIAAEATEPATMDENHALGNIHARLRALFLPGSGIHALVSPDRLVARVRLRCAPLRVKEYGP